MKLKLMFSLLLGGAMSMAAEGYMDGVEYFRADQPEEAAIILNNTLSRAPTRPQPTITSARLPSSRATRPRQRPCLTRVSLPMPRTVTIM